MILTQIKANNFRSCKSVEISIDSLTVFIGENDSGKSSILDILDIALNNAQPQPNDFYRDSDNNLSNEIEIELTFNLDDTDTAIFEDSINGVLTIKKVFPITGNQQSFILINAPEDDRFNVDFIHINAEEQKELLLSIRADLEASVISNTEKRKAIFDTLYNEQPKTETWKPVNNTYGKGLVLYERYNAMDYIDPAAIVGKTFRQVFEQSIYKVKKGDEQSVELIPQLKAVEKKARIEISKKVIELQDFVKKYCNNVVQIDYQPSFDFRNGIKQGEFYLNRGHGLHPLSRIGDGTKRRLFMAVTDWDREILSARPKDFQITPLIIRGYDEPDTNLHYEAQRLMYYSIAELANTKETGIQAILCTHSLTLIDRAPAPCIRLFHLDSDGCTRISRLETDDDPNIENFLKEIAAELGITNSIMFYERCFIIVEGLTEYNALPMLYKKVFSRSMIEDGIRIIDVQSNSSVNAFLRLFGLNKPELLLVFIDRDSENRRDLKLTASLLREIGYPNQFIENNIKFIGNMEFEDCFSDELIVAALNSYWPKNDGNLWSNEDIQNIRGAEKFSDAIRRIVWDHTNQNGNKWTKPEFGKALSETCPIDQIPEGITELFVLAQRIVGI